MVQSTRWEATTTGTPLNPPRTGLAAMTGPDGRIYAIGGVQDSGGRPGAIPGVAYHKQADNLAFAAARDFLTRAFGKTR